MTQEKATQIVKSLIEVGDVIQTKIQRVIIKSYYLQCGKTTISIYIELESLKDMSHPFYHDDLRSFIDLFGSNCWVNVTKRREKNLEVFK